MAVDSLWSSVTLLLPCSADLLDVKGHTVTVNGGAALSSAVGTPFGAGNSCYFDGSGDYLALADSSDWAFGTGDFFIDCWVYPTSWPGGGVNNDLCLFNIPGSPQFFFYVDNTTGKPTLWNGTSGYTGANALTLNAWNYVWCKRASSTLTIGIGTTTGITQASYTTNFAATTGATVGGLSGSRYMLGYLGGMRITKASRTVALPTAPFPRPTISGVVLDASAAAVAKTVLVTDRSSQRLVGGAISSATTGAYLFYPPDFGEYEVKRLDEVCDPFWNWRTLFMPMDGSDSSTAGIVDSLGHAVTLVGNTQLKTAQSITGGSSCYFDGTGDRITFAASADWDMSGGNFCIEFCIRADSLPSAGNFYRPIAIGPNGSTAGLQVYIMDNGIIGCGTPTTGNVNVFSSAGAIAANTWARIEISCVNGSAMIFKDGAVIAGPTVITAPVSSSSNALVIGYDAAAGVQFPGYIDRIRIGRVAGHTAAFTSDDNAFPAGPADGGSGENALIYDRVIPG